MEIKTFGVIGAGQMGNGIAQVAAASGLTVIMNDVKQEFVDKGLKTIGGLLARSVEKGKMTASEKDGLLGRIKGSVSLKDMAAADFVVEAATEKQDIKFQIFRDLDQMCKPGAILATNTSSIPIGRIAAQTKRPDKVIGMHFMNPVPVMKLVEIIPACRPRRQRWPPLGRWPKSSARPRPRPTTTPGSSPTAFCCRCSTRRSIASTTGSAPGRTSTR